MTGMARSNGEGSLFYDKTLGLWTASVELPPDVTGKRRRKKVTSKKKGVAIQKLRDLQRDIAIHGDIATRSITVEAWVEKWLTEIAPKKIKPTPLRSYRSALTKHVVKRWGNKKLAYLTTTRIRELIDEASPGTARNLHSYLKSCLHDAVVEGYLPRHPMEHLKMPARKKTTEAALSTDRTVELLRFLARQMDEGGDWAHIAPLFITYLLTGARRDELLGLRPEYVGESLDVAWQLERLAAEELAAASADYEYEHLGGSFYLTRPKYGSTRQYPLVEPLKTVVESIAAETPGGVLLFRRPDGDPWDPDGITYRWKKLMVAMGWEVHSGPEDLQTPVHQRVTPHGARHGLVDILYELEIPEQVIVDIVGHTSREMTRRYRTRLSPAAKDAMEEMSRLLTR